MHYQKPKLIFLPELPKARIFGAHTLLIYDQILLDKTTGFSEWARTFPASYAVRAGEELKNLARFPKHMEKILALTDEMPPRELVIVVAGGGSVGDFGGFVASILKRGVEVVQIPSTWLSAIDSAHGGKTALNVAGHKNQIGTFHSANRIFLIRSLLFSQGSEQVRDAFGELAKISLIDDSKAWRRLSTSSEKEGNLIWKFLSHAITAKNKIVSRDPFETKGIRQVLNLGHTVAHVIEAYSGLSHGTAVAQGLLFSLEWSHKRKLLKETAYRKMRTLLSETFLFQPLTELKGFHPIPQDQFLQLLQSDKKRQSSSNITFIFLKDFGKTRRVNIPIHDILEEAIAQGWVI